MKVLLDTELRPRKKWGVDAVESFMSPANLRSVEEESVFKNNRR